MTEALPAAIARQVGVRGEITIRSARPADAGALRHLAPLALSSWQLQRLAA
jgi:hypothetical protein